MHASSFQRKPRSRNQSMLILRVRLRRLTATSWVVLTATTVARRWAEIESTDRLLTESVGSAACLLLEGSIELARLRARRAPRRADETCVRPSPFGRFRPA